MILKIPDRHSFGGLFNTNKGIIYAGKDYVVKWRYTAQRHYNCKIDKPNKKASRYIEFSYFCCIAPFVGGDGQYIAQYRPTGSYELSDFILNYKIANT